MGYPRPTSNDCYATLAPERPMTSMGYACIRLTSGYALYRSGSTMHAAGNGLTFAKHGGPNQTICTQA
eukprot:833452-Lingulodinium_polyedra.AAC.1